jgi:uncharacterized protein YbcI
VDSKNRITHNETVNGRRQPACLVYRPWGTSSRSSPFPLERPIPRRGAPKWRYETTDPHGAEAERTSREVGQGSRAAKISDTVVGVLRTRTGRGPTRAKTTISDDLVACVVHDTLTAGERRLVANGQSDLVLTTRRHYQEAMETGRREGAERPTDRKVIAFMSDNYIDPDMAVEACILEPHLA